MVQVAQTDRLVLRHLTPDDAPFYRQQLNEPSWLAHIGDRQVHTLADADAHLRANILPPYAERGFGMYLVQRRADAAPVGICGLVQREALPAPDLGFALLDAHAGLGYAQEAAQAVLRHAFADLGLDRVLAITAVTNQRSDRLLDKLGFAFQGMVPVGARSLRLYTRLPDAPGW
ncbi:GNAT family N-acetyltransferase [Pseudorhodoferax sp. Leaf267]|uniref:GNAT family N-acetyltransferase n=1 Tax=Pseudorhodoferax sp. Leaf267 TaxID=1736316 RepID=UPI0006F5C12D|nr:GNAT family N-acetyltransferase [Pseudorhodoferax sp. Leaf267]KQP12779.1 hypothetical protein ASF43_21455 [Pseudorhodoferax sp. Leaf267]